jgi:F-type H+/Na+-transporting ATPase subunit alpha
VRKVAGRLRLDLAQYRELAAFAQFGSDLDKATQDKLAQGVRLMETLKQAQYSPRPVEEQVAILYAAVNGHLMEMEVPKVRPFLDGLVEYLKMKHGDLLDGIARTGAIAMETDHELTSAVETYKSLVR